jgi:hypothetical protein
MADKPSQSEVDQWRALYAAGGHAANIAKQFGRSHHVIRRAIADIKRAPGLPSQIAEKVLELYKSGLGSKRIAKQTGLPRTTIRRVIELSGCKVKKPPTAWNKGLGKYTRYNANTLIIQSYKYEAHKIGKFDELRHWAMHPEVNRFYARQWSNAKYNLMTVDERNERYKKQKSHPNYSNRMRASRKRWKTNPGNRVRSNLSVRLYAAIMGNSRGSKGVNLYDVIGCTIEQLRSHLELQFSHGMTWQNYGKWHVDHIIPCAAFDHTDKDQIKLCWNWQNLRPLWARRNLRKGASITQPQMCLPLPLN